MAKKKQTKKTNVNKDLGKKVDSLVDEIERTHKLKKIELDEELEEEREKVSEKEVKATKKTTKKNDSSNKVDSNEEKKKEEKSSDDKKKDTEEKKLDEEVLDKDDEQEEKPEEKDDEKLEEKQDDVVDEKVEDKKEEVEDEEDFLDEEKEKTEMLDVEEIKEELEEIIESVDDKYERIKELENTITEQLEIIDDFTAVIEPVVDKKEDKTDKEEDTKDLNKTNSYNMKFDENRLEEAQSLDTSFLEGRIKKSAEAVKKLPGKKAEDVVNRDRFNKILKILFFLVLFVVVIVGIVLLIKLNPIKVTKIKKSDNKEIISDKVDNNKNKVIDDNYLFVGSYYTKSYNLSTYYDKLPVVNSSEKDTTTKDLLDNMKEKVYNYNPSKVFIEIGINDYIDKESTDYITSNIESIIKNIKKNRPYSEIYIESIYPINNSDDDKINARLVRGLDNEEIEDINNEIKNICKDNNVNYIDLYKVLFSEEDNGLKLDYTTDGLNLTEEGYKAITKEIKKYL